ncbi:MAG: methyltransferase family protein [Candidatus Thorarchaeota archaeon]
MAHDESNEPSESADTSAAQAYEVQEDVVETDIGSSGTIKSRVTTIIAAILPFIQSIPPMAIWGGLMTIPLLSYLALMFTSSPMTFLGALISLFFGGFVWELAIAVIGVALVVYSVLHLRRSKHSGLVKNGPYGLVRHPQYLGVILFTMTLTTRSYWIITNTFGMGFLGPTETLMVWFATLFAYVVLASVEELHLSKSFGNEYQDYRREVGFMWPYLKTESRIVEILVTVVVSALLLFGIVYLNAMLLYPPPFLTW